MTDLAEFLAAFARPFVVGGDLHIGAPVDAATLATWEVDLGGHAEALEAIDEARAQVAAALVVRPPPLVFGAAELRLLVALYDALVLAHPAAGTWPGRRGRRAIASFAHGLASVAPPAGRTEILARHALLHGLFEVRRVDTRLSWWTGRAEFHGTEPPRRLMLWRDLRRVREWQSEVPLPKVVGEDEAPIVARLIAASPLTDLLGLGTPARSFPVFRWHGAVVEVLRDAELARAIAYRWLAELAEREGGPGEAADPAGAAQRLRAAAAASDAWEEALVPQLEVLVRRGPNRAVVPRTGAPSGPAIAPADLRAATAFLVHLAALLALAEVGHAEPDAPSPLVAASLAAKRTGDPWDVASGLRLLFSVPDVAARVEPGLGEPPGVRADARVARRWNAHRAQVRAAFGEERLAQLARRLAAALAV